MKNEWKIRQIGRVEETEEGFALKLEKTYREGLIGIEGFSWLNILWWADQTDGEDLRQILTTEKPYTRGPDKLGIFATRSPVRPNPIAVTAVYVLKIDLEAGIVYTPYIDAEPGTPLLDIKPYHGSTDVAEGFKVPGWCDHWPKSIQESADFAWEEEFNF